MALGGPSARAPAIVEPTNRPWRCFGFQTLSAPELGSTLGVTTGGIPKCPRTATVGGIPSACPSGVTSYGDGEGNAHIVRWLMHAGSRIIPFAEGARSTAREVDTRSASRAHL